MKKKKYYLHTINGYPGGFNDTQICYRWRGMKLVSNLDQIKAERKKSKAYRIKCGFNVPTYGHILVYLPD